MTGALRVSLGYSSTQEECDYFANFLKETFIDKENSIVASELSAVPVSCALSAFPSGDPFSVKDICLYECLNTFTIPALVHPISESSVVVSAIYVYPIKSCGGK